MWSVLSMVANLESELLFGDKIPSLRQGLVDIWSDTVHALIQVSLGLQGVRNSNSQGTGANMRLIFRLQMALQDGSLFPSIGC